MVCVCVITSGWMPNMDCSLFPNAHQSQNFDLLDRDWERERERERERECVCNLKKNYTHLKSIASKHFKNPATSTNSCDVIKAPCM